MKSLIILTALVAAVLANEDLKKILNDGNKQFTAKFFNEAINQVGQGKSMVMSAFSVIQPLAQLALASAGESHDQLLHAIGLPNDNVTKEVFPLVNADLRAVKGIELKMANKIYIPKDQELKEDFSAVSKSVFGSEVGKIDFLKSGPAANEINAWVEDHTNKRIKNLIAPSTLGPDTRAVLVNALYFKGEWADQFNKELTEDRDFHVTKNKTVKIPTMYKKKYFNYGASQELDAKLLEVRYKGDEASMLIVLPNQIDGLPALLEKLKNPSALDAAVENMHEVEVELYLPKFKIETEIDLKSVLQKIGITNLFHPGKARLENLLKGEKDLFVSDAIQKAFIEVNEEGAEAAAANGLLVNVMAYTIPHKFDVDHPFVYFVKHGNLTLFSGVLQS